MIKAEQILTAATPTQWADLLQAENHRYAYFDVLFEQALFSEREIQKIKRQYHASNDFMVLAGTQHADSAEIGPRLLRFPLASSGALLNKALITLFNKTKPVFLLGGLAFESIAEHIQRCTLVEWDDARQNGILRFSDSRLFAVIADALNSEAQAFLLSAAPFWYWQDRDSNAQYFDNSMPFYAENSLVWPHPGMVLEQKQVDLLSAWHQAELWRQNDMLYPELLGLDSQENMMKKLVTAQLAADQAGLWSETERQPFLQQQVGLK
ncbi:DUF4123 domain-containing protein [Iodobacter sp.]|uniref:DUF4123 domain-containing protein n=1 Tax=Iodobacter sp. TaxID=1915058 RepID=UPI0025E8B910|nr:DUF4123 domain-containing protein [Iodobacter sp.]